MLGFFMPNLDRTSFRKTLRKMFACRKPKQRFESNSNKWDRLYFELKKLKRIDIVDILQNELSGERLHHVLEIHGSDETHLQLDCPPQEIVMKIYVDEDLQKVEKLLIEATKFADAIIMFHSLSKQFTPVRMLISDYASIETVISCEPLTRYFEIYEPVSVYQIENIAESVKQEMLQDKGYEFEMIRFSNCNLLHEHMISLQNLIRYTKRLDLNGNGCLLPHSLNIMSVSMTITKPFRLVYLNLSNCNLTDSHISYLQSLLVRVEELDLSYNEDLSPKVMSTIADSIIEHIRFDECHLKTLVLVGCNMTEEHVKQLYRCISFLGHLDLSINNMLSPFSMTIISDSILAHENNSKAKSLSLRLENCQITESHMNNLKDCIPLLKELDLSWNELDMKSLKKISEALHDTKGDLKLRSLKLMGCELKEKHLIEIAKWVVYLESLTIGYNQLSCSDCIRVLSEEIYSAREHGEWSSFRRLHIGGLEINDSLDDDSDQLNWTYSRIDMLGINCKKSVKNQLGKSLEFLSSLEELNLCGNTKFSPFTAKILSESIVKMNELKVDCFLRQLNLSDCNLQDVHIEMFLPCLVYLITLDISFNPSLTSASMKLMADCILQEQGNLILEYLNISSCGLTDSHIRCLQGCYVNIKKVDMSKNKLTGEAMRLILKEVGNACKSRGPVKLETMHVWEAFSVRNYNYRVFETDMRKYGVNIINIHL